MFEYEWTDDKNIRVYWDEEEITDEPIENPGSGYRYDGGFPAGLIEYCTQWVSEQSVPDENKLQDAIEQLAAIVAKDFEERDQS